MVYSYPRTAADRGVRLHRRSTVAQMAKKHIPHRMDDLYVFERAGFLNVDDLYVFVLMQTAKIGHRNPTQ